MGLLKTGLKAAVAVKTADVIHERVLARQQEHAAAQGHPAPAGQVMQPGSAAPIAAAPAPAPAAASPDMGDKLAQLKQLGELREAGVLTDAEFAAQKAQILSA
jgi:Short C-terminal domain